MAWLSSGRILNPTLDLVLVDSGVITNPGPKNFQVFAASTVASAFEIQWRDAANTATLKSQIIAVPAFGSISFYGFLREIDMAINERIRVIQVAAVTGSVSVSLEMLT